MELPLILVLAFLAAMFILATFADREMKKQQRKAVPVRSTSRK